MKFYLYLRLKRFHNGHLRRLQEGKLNVRQYHQPPAFFSQPLDYLRLQRSELGFDPGNKQNVNETT